MAVTHLWVTATARGGDRILQKITGRVSKKFRSLLQNVFQKVEKQAESKTTWTDKAEICCKTGRSPFLVDVANLSRDAFVKIFPQRSMTSLSASSRLGTARKLMSSGWCGKTKKISAFAFVGLCYTMQQESSLSTNEEFVCTEIRNIFQKFYAVNPTTTDDDLSVKDFQFGNFIAKGSFSAVHEAKFINRLPSNNTDDGQSNQSVDDNAFLSSEDDANFSLTSSHTEFLQQPEFAVQFTSYQTELYNSSEELSQDGSGFCLLDEPDLLAASIADDDVVVIGDCESDTEVNSLVVIDKLGVELAAAMVDDILTEDDLVVDDEVVQETESLNGEDEDEDASMNCDDDDPEFDLVIKMMFNYSAESTAEAVTMAMEKEMVPLKLAVLNTTMADTDKWRFWRRKRKTYLPLHPNIVDMKAAFVDQVADLPENRNQYPAALPQRLHPDGLGRNMTMFLVMKRYSSTLRDFVRSKAPDVYTSCLLICQLLEGVTFLWEVGVVHRDLKSDNILLDLTRQNAPWLVISDFGCCLSDDVGLQIPYNTGEISKGGNRALMAPEIASAQPGMFSVLDYRKSDVWTVGSLVYEVFGQENPFYTLDSVAYSECDLPPLPETCPWLIRKLALNLLQRDPSKRLDPAVAANVMHLFLWRPSWFTKPSNENVQDWLLAFSREVAYREVSLVITGSKASVKHMLQRNFYLRLHFNELIRAVNFVFD